MTSNESSHHRCPPHAFKKLEVPCYIKNILKRDLRLFIGITDKEEHYRNLMIRLSKMNELPFYGHLEMLKLLLYVEQFYGEEEFKSYSLDNPSLSLDVQRKMFKIEVPAINKNHPFINVGDLIFANMNQLTICEIHDGFIYAKATLGSGMSTGNPVLIPNQSPMISSKMKDENWINLKVKNNKEQKQAVINIINKTAINAPYILVGPPGTGKTVTIVETILQIYFNDLTSKVLICTPTNNAADEITKRLIVDYDTQSMNLLRFYSASRDYNLIDDKIKPYANIMNELGHSIPYDAIIKKRIIICTLATSKRLIRMRLPSTYFSYLFIDEASQATEAETLIPFLLLSSDSNPNTYTQVVLCGDPLQLGPVVRSKFVGHLLEISMMERLMKLEIYRSDCSKKNSNYITNLVRNFRNHPKILKMPNELFYENKLLACGKSDMILDQNWEQLKNKKFPIIFHAVYGNEYQHQGCPSVYNSQEIKIVMEYLKMLTQGLPKFSLERIGIVTPYSLQADCIKKCLEYNKISGIHVGTVQVYQGEEKDIIILSTVRTRLLLSPNGYHIGFISNSKRINVSLTRAKSLLIVVGNPNVLKYDSKWKTFLSYCVNNNACQGETFSLETSRAECLLWYKHPIFFPYRPSIVG